jgi:Poly(R)-hydroxyalkanoic acid synthase subunit (PHA_synth_III_E)
LLVGDLGADFALRKSATALSPFPEDSPELPWLRAWRAAEAELSQLSGINPAAAETTDALRRLQEFGGQVAALAAAVAPQAAMQGHAASASTAHFESYRRLFASGLPQAAPEFSQILAGIAADAAARFATELGRGDSDARPITSLRELFELWIDCGEAAWAAAAHREAFAVAQAKLLAAIVELRRPQGAR